MDEIFEHVLDPNKNVGRYCNLLGIEGVYVVKEYMRRVRDGEYVYHVKHISKPISRFIDPAEITRFLDMQPSALSNRRGGPRRWK